MSIESAKAFLERMRNDEDFRKSVEEIATAEERMEYVKEAGFDFTKDEIASHKDELTEEELVKAAGGSGCNSGASGCHQTGDVGPRG
jgi:predicted ribosomally synthesized peptide with nif11-like leader